MGDKHVVLLVSESIIREEGCVCACAHTRVLMLTLLTSKKVQKTGLLTRDSKAERMQLWRRCTSFSFGGGGVKGSPKENLIFSLRSLTHMNDFS